MCTWYCLVIFKFQIPLHQSVEEFGQHQREILSDLWQADCLGDGILWVNSMQSDDTMRFGMKLVFFSFTCIYQCNKRVSNITRLEKSRILLQFVSTIPTLLSTVVGPGLPSVWEWNQRLLTFYTEKTLSSEICLRLRLVLKVCQIPKIFFSLQN